MILVVSLILTIATRVLVVGQRTVTKFNTGSTPRGVALDHDNSNLFVAAKGSESISKISLSVGTVNKSYIGGLHDPVGVTFDNVGNLYVSDVETKIIRVYDSLGTLINDNFGGPLLNFVPDAIELDSVGSALFVYSYSDGQVRKIDATGVLDKNSFITMLPAGHGGLFFDAKDNCLYVTDSSANSIKKRQLAGGGVVTVAVGFNRPCDVVLDCFGYLYVSNFGNNTISKVTQQGIAVEHISIAALDGPCGLEIDTNGNLYISSVNSNSVIKISG